MILASCGSNVEKGEKLDPEQTKLVRYYQEMREIGLSGRVEDFLAMRDSVTNAEVDQYFEWKGWVIDSAKVSNWAFNWPDIVGMPLEQDTIHGLWRRMVFRRCGLIDETGKEQCLYPVVLFHKDGDQWKVSNATRLASYRYNEDGSPRTLNEFMFHKLFRLPPSFDDLKERDGPPPDYQFRPINPEDTLPKK
jgi:hypothetical protein